MLSCILFLMPFLAFQGAGLGITVGKTYPSCKDNQYKRNTMGGVSCNLRFTDNLEVNFQYSRISLDIRKQWGWKSTSSDEIYGTLRAVSRAFDFVDVYALGGGGVYVNSSRKANVGMCYGLGLRKTIKPPISLELNFLIHHVLDERPSMKNWRSFSIGIGIRLPQKTLEQIPALRNEVEIVARYLSPGLRKSIESKSDEERNELVERFWKANDPTPHTPENEFREEIQSRIRYANRWFREIREGWETERGRIWILLGEPDEIVRREEDAYSPERWVYRRVYKHIVPLVFVFQRQGICKQVFSNIPGEFGYDLRSEVYYDEEDDRVRP